MDNNTKITPMESTAEELEAEKEQLEEGKVDREELKDKLIEDLGLDPDTQDELIEKLLDKDIENRTKFSKVIRRKINLREELEEERKKNPPKPEAKPQEKTEEKVDVKAEVLSVLEEERLADMDLSDPIKEKIKMLSKLNNISVKKAAEDPYIKGLIDEEKAAEKAENAGISPTKKGTRVKFDIDNPPQVDVSTEEGRKQWDEWKKFVKSQKK
jgi:hypothetical protein